MRYIYCHPLFDERKCAHRFSYQLKITFQKSGLMLERFDYRGTGEAEGRFENVSLDSLKEDVEAQINGDEVCLIGLRFGAILALYYAAAHPGIVKKLVLLEPIVDGATHVDYLYRKQHIKDLMTGESADKFRENGFVNIEGYKTSARFLDQIKNINLAMTVKENPPTSPVLIIQISNHTKFDPEILSLAGLLESSDIQTKLENINIPIFWERIPISDYSELKDAILRWCRD